MNTDEIPQLYLNGKDTKNGTCNRVFGRYNSSELYYIVTGKLKPKDFLKTSPVDRFGASLIIAGIGAEDIWTKMLTDIGADFIPQDKKEIKINDEITLVAKPDFNFKSFLVEMKKPKDISPIIPEKWEYQLEAYYRGFQLPIQLWQCCDDITKLYKLEFVPSDERWEKVKRKLIEFHEEIKKLYGKEKNIK